MAIQLTQPVVVPAVAEAHYDKAWLTELHVNAGNCNGEAVIRGTLRPCRTKPDGTREFGPGRIEMTLPAFFAEAVYDPQKIGAILSLFAGLSMPEKLAVAQQCLDAAIEAYGRDAGLL